MGTFMRSFVSERFVIIVLYVIMYITEREANGGYKLCGVYSDVQQALPPAPLGIIQE